MDTFNLNKALSDWKKNLNKYEGFEPGNAEEIISHVSDAIDDLVATGMTEEEAFHKVTRDKIGDLQKLSQEYHKAKSLTSAPSSSSGRSLTSNFIKVAFRNILKSRPHSFINLAGFAVGLASVIIISVYVYSELSFDRFHKDYRQIYRIVNKVQRSGTSLNYPQGPPGLAPSLTSNFPEIEYATRLRIADRPLIQYEDKNFYEDNVFYADSSFFKIFDFELLEGDKVSCLNQPNQVVLSESIAKKYFGEEDAIDKILMLDGTRPLRVTAVVKDVPHNSHLYFEMLLSFQTFIVPEGYLENLDSWTWLGFFTYVKTFSDVDISELENKVVTQFQKGDARWADMDLTILLQPLKDIYLGSSELNNPQNVFRGNSYVTLYSLIAVGILIIVIASFNYINLSIAMSISRFKEIAMRKVLGSSKSKLVQQFILESIVYTMIALILAIALVLIANQVLPDNVTSKLVLEKQSLLLYSASLILFVCLIGVISGIFPALRLSSITSLELLKGNFKLKSGNFRNVLIGFQFALSAGLVAISLIIGKQIDFFSSTSLGYIKEGIISINVSSDQVEGKTEALQNQIEKQAGVASVSLSTHIMGEGLSGNPLYLPGQQPEDAIQMAYFQTDYNFAQTIGLEMVQGRYFSRDFARDSTESIILNETAVKTLGLEDPVGKKVVFTRGLEREIIGVVKDFHYGSLHHAIAPMAIIMPYTSAENLVIRIQSDNLFRTLNSIESEWNATFPNVPFEFRFMDDYIESLYQKENFFAKVIQFFTFLAIGIACLGLYSLAAISLAGKIKQISIRRVLGAPINSILVLTGKNFLLLVLIATVLSWPMVWYVMNLWLSNFAYHIELNVWFFAITFIAILGITVLTISYHLYKAVTINPAETLRDN